MSDTTDARLQATAAAATSAPAGPFVSLCRTALAQLRLPAAVVGCPDADGWRTLEAIGIDGTQASAALAIAAAGGTGEGAAHAVSTHHGASLGDDPALGASPGFRFLAAASLTRSTGELIGRLCVLDTRARRATRAMRESLADLAEIGASLLGQHLLTSRLEREIAERHESELALRVMGARLRAAVDSLPFQFWMVDGQGRCIMQNREDERVWGDILGRHIYDPLADMEQNQEWQRWLARAFAGETVSFEMRYERDGGPADVEEIIAPVDLDGKLIGLVGLGIDFTARRRAEAALAVAQRRLQALTEADIVGIVLGEGDRITGCNREFLRIIGRPGVSPESLAATVLRDAASGFFYARLQSELLKGGSLGPLEYELRRPDGAAVPVLLSAALVERAPVRWLGLVQDISEQKQAEARIRELADTDALTRLANRRSFLQALERSLATMRPGELGAVLLLDLDRFKEINDTLGHDAGDALLQAVAERLLAQSRAVDTVARLGGDEFAIILGRIGSAADVRAIAERILVGFAPAFAYGGCELHVRASIGISLFPDDGQTASVILKNADIALYQAKGQGRGTLSFFDPGLRIELERKRLLGDALRQGIVEDRIELVFQPQVSLADGAQLGFEALVRWRRDGVLLPPSAFLAVADENGLALPIGRTVVRKALEQMRAWLDLGLEPGRIAINVAAGQLKVGDFAAELAGLLASHRVPPERVEVELTENVLLEGGQDRVASVLRAVSELGVSIALDDFGTGYASFAHLQRLPVDRLKIDRSFVHELDAAVPDTAIVLNIISLAHALGLEVVAEGIETSHQRQFLVDAGCEIGQGFLFAPGLDGDAATRRLRRASAQAVGSGSAEVIRFPPRQLARRPRR